MPMPPPLAMPSSFNMIASHLLIIRQDGQMSHENNHVSEASHACLVSLWIYNSMPMRQFDNCFHLVGFRARWYAEFSGTRTHLRLSLPGS